MRRRNLVALRGQTGMPPAFICEQKKERERKMRRKIQINLAQTAMDKSNEAQNCAAHA